VVVEVLAEEAGAKIVEPSAAPDGAGPAPGQRFLDAFGDQGGVWFAQGRSFEEAQALCVADMRAENEKLKARLASVDRGEQDPVTFQADPASGSPETDSKAARLRQNLGENLATFATGIKFRQAEPK